MTRRLRIQIGLIIVLVIIGGFLVKRAFQEDGSRSEQRQGPAQDEAARERLRSLGYLN